MAGQLDKMTFENLLLWNPWICKTFQKEMKCPWRFLFPLCLPPKCLKPRSGQKAKPILTRRGKGLIPVFSHMFKNQSHKVKRRNIFVWWTLYLWINLYEPRWPVGLFLVRFELSGCEIRHKESHSVAHHLLFLAATNENVSEQVCVMIWQSMCQCLEQNLGTRPNTPVPQ